MRFDRHQRAKVSPHCLTDWHQLTQPQRHRKYQTFLQRQELDALAPTVAPPAKVTLAMTAVLRHFDESAP